MVRGWSQDGVGVGLGLVEVRSRVKPEPGFRWCYGVMVRV